MGQAQIRVLLVDDHHLFREGLKRILEMEPDMKVVGEFSNGEETLKSISFIQSDVILMDINMPSMNGVEATSEIMKIAPNARVIILSIHDDEYYVYRTLRGGASGYLLKEMEAEQLIDAVRKVAAGGCYIHPKVTGKVIEEFRRLSDEETVLRQQLAATSQIEVAGKEMWEILSPREREVLKLMSEGNNNRAIGELLYISEKTVKNHVSSILLKMNVEDRTQAVIRAVKNGWIAL